MKFSLGILLVAASLATAVPYVTTDSASSGYTADANVNQEPVAEDDCTTAYVAPEQTGAAPPIYQDNTAPQNIPGYGGQAGPQEPVANYGATDGKAADPGNAGGTTYPENSGKVGNDESYGSYSFDGSAVNTAPLKLLPAIHWSQDASHIGTISPSGAGSPTSLYYCENGVAEPTKSFYWGVIELFFNSPAVVLDHTTHIRSVTWNGAQQQLAIVFDSEDAFTHAQRLWTNELIIVTDTPGCAESQDDERCYIKVSALSFQSDGRTLIVSGTPSPLESCITGGESQWGIYKPRGGYSDASGPGPSKDNSTVGDTPPFNETDPFGVRNATCTGPVDTKYNLPSACLGPFFDTDLDDQLGSGLLSAKDHELLDNVLSRVETPQRRSIFRKRGPFSFFSSSKPSITNVVNNIGKVITTVGQKTTELITTGSISGDFHDTFSFKIPNGSPIEDPTAKQVTSPWGDAILLSAFGNTSSFLNIFCVGCGAEGQIEIGGKLTWSTTDGITDGYIDILADVKGILKLGVDGRLVLKGVINPKKSIYTLFFSPLFFGPISVGPAINIAMRVGLDSISSRGRILSGGEFSWNKARAVVDIINPSNSRRENYDPVFKPISQSAYSPFVGAELGLPLSFGFTLKVLIFTKNTGISNEPMVRGVFKSADNANLRDSSDLTAGFTPLPGCTGTSTSVSWRDELYTQVLSVKGISLMDTGYKLIDKFCIPGSASKRDTHPDQNTLQLRQLDEGLTPGNFSLPDGIRDVTGEVANGSAIATYDLVDVPSQPYNRSDGIEFTMLVEQSGKNNHAIFCENGNIYLKGATDALQLGCEDLWAFVDHNVFSDGEGRFLHYYKHTMDLLGVSRLRLTDAVIVTNDTEAVALIPFSAEGAGVPADPATEGLYVATDDDENVLWLTICMYSDGQAPKAFLVKDPEKGPGLLSSPDLKYTVTGGTVSTCLPLVLKQGDEHAGQWASPAATEPTDANQLPLNVKQ